MSSYSRTIQLVYRKQWALTSRQIQTDSQIFLTILALLCVANLYYAQPLLYLIQQDFQIDSGKAGLLNTMSQVGYAIGLIIITPLGDIFRRKYMILVLLALTGIFLIGMATAYTSYAQLLTFTFLMGMVTVTPQVVIPLVADLTPLARRSKTLGFVMSGVIFGVLLSRTISGWIGNAIDFHGVYYVAAGFQGLLFIISLFWLPNLPQTNDISYFKVFKSLAFLIKTEPILVQASIQQFMFFGTFSNLWTILTFRLSAPPYNYSSGIIGLFGFVGAAGVLMAPVAGIVADRYGPYPMAGIGMFLTIFSWAILIKLDNHLAVIVVAVVLVDFSIQAIQICNQNRIFALVPGARSRLNSIYMTSGFTGAAIASALGSWAYDHYGWEGSCALSLVMSGMGIATYIIWPLLGWRIEPTSLKETRREKAEIRRTAKEIKSREKNKAVEDGASSENSSQTV